MYIVISFSRLVLIVICLGLWVWCWVVVVGMISSEVISSMLMIFIVMVMMMVISNISVRWIVLIGRFFIFVSFLCMVIVSSGC